MKFNGLTITLTISCFQTLILIYLIYNSNLYSNVTISKPKSMINSNQEETQQENISKFRKIVSKLGIDKEFHRYYNMYGIYLGPKRHKPLNFLEIGLGCTMKYGAGKSMLAWRQYLTHSGTNISFVEFDRECAEKFRNEVSHLFIGDQSDFEFLERVGKEGGPYDIIVDDGGHKRTFQVSII